MPSKLIPLDTEVHDRQRFESGRRETDLFLKTIAGKSAGHLLSKTFVRASDSDEREIAAFLSLVICTDTPPAGSSRLQRNKTIVPGILIAQLGVDKKHQGKGIGVEIVAEAITMYAEEALRSNMPQGVGLFVDAAEDTLIPFYEKCGFVLVDPEDPECRRLWMKAGNCLSLLEASNAEL
ncbi:MAG: hypothetical protein CMH98_13925 [Oceanospirillaceae bacterium]|nr:hypothetical protein [Oceanospirillaceae bacterium]